MSIRGLKVSGIAQWLSSTAARAQGKKEAGVLQSNADARAAVDARNKATTDQFNTDTAYRGGLIDSQRGGLASTILNLGGAAGDPEHPFASQAVGTEAAAATPVLEKYAPDKPLPIAKKAGLFGITGPTFGGRNRSGLQ